MPAAGINFSKEETVAQVHASHMPTAAASGSEDARTRRWPQDNSGMDEMAHSCNASRVRAHQEKQTKLLRSLSSVHAYQNKLMSIYIYRSIY